MKKNLKKSYSSMSRRKAIICLTAAAIALTSSVGTVNAFAENNTEATQASSTNETSVEANNVVAKNPILIDSKKKSWFKLNKIEEHAGFDFKVPSYCLNDKKPSEYSLLKKADGNNIARIIFGFQVDQSYELMIFKGSIEENLKERIKYDEEGDDADLPYDSIIWQYHEDNVDLGGIQGKEVSMTETVPSYMIGGQYKTEQYTRGSKCVVVTDGDVNYCIKYTGSFEKESVSKYDYDVVNRDEAIKILKSLKDSEEITDMYNGDDLINTMSYRNYKIYDRDDVKDEGDYLGSEIKLPLNDDGKLVLSDSYITCCYLNNEQQVYDKNDEHHYSLMLTYNYGDNQLHFTQSNYDYCDFFSEFNKNGCLTIEGRYFPVVNPIVPEKINIDGQEVYRYLYLCKDISGVETNQAIYVWQKDGVYYHIKLLNSKQYDDELVKKFVNAKVA